MSSLWLASSQPSDHDIGGLRGFIINRGRNRGRPIGAAVAIDGEYPFLETHRINDTRPRDRYRR